MSKSMSWSYWKREHCIEHTSRNYYRSVNLKSNFSWNSIAKKTNETSSDEILPYEARADFCLIFRLVFWAMKFQDKNVFEIYWPLSCSLDLTTNLNLQILYVFCTKFLTNPNVLDLKRIFKWATQWTQNSKTWLVMVVHSIWYLHKRVST